MTKVSPYFAATKRGHVAVLEVVHISTDLKWKKTTWKTYELIKATKVAKGKILNYTTASGSHGIIHSSHRVMVIVDAEKQAAAKDLFLSNPTFDSIEAVKDAIIDRAEALR